MKLSISNLAALRNNDDRYAFKMIKEAGFDSIDFCLSERESYLFSNNYIEWATDLKHMLDEIELDCTQAHAPYEFRFGENMDISCENYLGLVRSIEVASIIGAKNLIIHSIEVPENTDVVSYNLKFYKSFIPFCEKYDIHISVENLYEGQYANYRGRLGTAKELTDFVKKINSTWFNACIDVGHAAITDVEPQYFIKGMDNKILKTLHIHDTAYKRDLHTIPYLGTQNWEEICKALGEIDYNGDFNFEVLYSPNIDDDILACLLKFTEAIGRKLISKIEESKI